MNTRRKTRRGSPLHITSALDLFGKSKQLIVDNLSVFGPLYILPAMYLVGSWLENTRTLSGTSRWNYNFQNHAAGWTSPTFPTYSGGILAGIGIFALFWVIVSIIVQIMTQSAQLTTSEGKKPQFSALWETVKQLGWRMVGLYIVIGLMFLAAALPIVLLAFVVSWGVVVGLIISIVLWAMLLQRVFLAPYVLLDDKKGIEETLRRSAKLSNTKPGGIWGVFGVMFLIGLVSIVPFIGSLASFILAFLYSVAPALRYQELNKIVK